MNTILVFIIYIVGVVLAILLGFITMFKQKHMSLIELCGIFLFSAGSWIAVITILLIRHGDTMIFDFRDNKVVEK